VTFALYKEQSGDAPLWVEVQIVTADAKGHFIALLGATSPGGLPLNLFTTGEARWLGMQASGQPELPRTFLASVPYALAPLSAVSASGQPVAANAGPTPALTTATTSGTASLAGGAAPLVPASPPTPIATVVTDSTSGLTSSKSGSTVTLSLITSCGPGQLLKWNGTAWGCTADTDVMIGVTGGGLNVYANGTSPNIVAGYGGNAVVSGAFGAAIGGGGESKPDGGLCPPFPAPCNANNRVAQSFGTVAGGESNQAGDNAGAAATRSYATVGGGRSNVASGLFSTVPGGNQNTAAGSASFAAGLNARANHNGSFVWSDSSSASPFASTAVNQFLIRANGGVGIGTNSPTQALDVAGTVKADGLCIGTDCRNAWPSGGGTITGVTPDVGLSGGGTSGNVKIGVDFATTQRRVRENCGPGSAIYGVNADGTVNCLPIFGNGFGGQGTANAVARFLNGTALGPSQITDDGTNVTIGATNVTIGSLGGLRISGDAAPPNHEKSPNMLGGASANYVSPIDFGSAFYGATIAGGGTAFFPNQVSGSFGFVGGGLANQAGEEASVAGGMQNAATGGQSTVAGGLANTAGGFYSAIGGGAANKTTGLYSTVPGGLNNEASGQVSFAAGRQARAATEGTFVWADNTGTDETDFFSSSAPNQFLIRATGGVGIGTTVPTQALDVAGKVKADGLCIGTDCRTAWPAASGTITGVTTTSGLTGGGTSGSVTLGVDFTTTQKRVSNGCVGNTAIQTVNDDGTVGCVSVTGLGIGGSGTPNVMPRFVAPSVIGNSQIADDGTNVVIGSNGGYKVVGDPTGVASVVGGFSGNFISGTGSTIAGGGGPTVPNRVLVFSGFVGGGADNQAGDDPLGRGSYATVTGGLSNTASGGNSSVGGGFVNQATGFSSTISGGYANTASGDYSTVPGGDNNIASGIASFAAGWQAEAVTNGTFVWGDYNLGHTFTSTAPNQFLIHASGGVGIGTNAPSQAVDVVGNVKADGLCIGADCRTAWPSGGGGGGTITGVSATNGLTGGGTSGAVSLGIASAGVTNAMLQNSSITLNAGTGLSGGGAVALGGSSAVSVDFTTTQKRLSSSCAAGNAIRAVDSNGILTCEPIPAGLGGSGSVAFIPKFTAGTSLGNSRISDDATNIVLGDSTLGSIRLLGNATSPNLIGGAANNSIASGTVGATIAGGGDVFAVGGNHVDANYGTVGGGDNNRAGLFATVAGGSGNAATNSYAAITGGQTNNATGQFAIVSGGSSNTAGGTRSAIGGGGSNGASGDYATVPGGLSNIAAGSYSFAAGQGAQANHSNTFVWSDGMFPFVSSADRQFLIQANGGVGIGTNSPGQALDVNGNVKANGLCIGTDCRTAWPSGGGTGTITSVTAGTGLAGGGTTGDVTLSIPSAGVTNAMLQHNLVGINVATGLLGGGAVSLGSSIALGIDTSIVPRLNFPNTFTVAQSVTAPNANGGALTVTNTATGGGWGVFATTPALSGSAALRGDATATTGSSLGVLGQSFASGGTGVEGVNQSATGTNFGVRGETQSNGVNSAGVYGAESSATGTTFGVFGQSISNAGVGVYGTEPSTSGTVSGVYGTTASVSGTGVFGQATASTGGATGGHFSSFSNAGNGVWGSSDNSAGIGIGVLGTASSASGVGGVFSNSGGGDLILGRTSAAVQFRVASTGNVTAAGSFTGGGADFAESVDVVDGTDSYEPGDVMVVDPTSDRRFALSHEAYSPLVAGVYSTKPGMLGSRTSMDPARTAQEVPMAVVGIVPTKVSTENGPIQRGDLLVASSTPGYAMKGTDRSRMLGAVIGKALEPLAEGKGVIEVLVTVR